MKTWMLWTFQNGRKNYNTEINTNSSWLLELHRAECSDRAVQNSVDIFLPYWDHPTPATCGTIRWDNTMKIKKRGWTSASEETNSLFTLFAPDALVVAVFTAMEVVVVSSTAAVDKHLASLGFWVICISLESEAACSCVDGTEADVRSAKV